MSWKQSSGQSRTKRPRAALEADDFHPVEMEDRIGEPVVTPAPHQEPKKEELSPSEWEERFLAELKQLGYKTTPDSSKAKEIVVTFFLRKEEKVTPKVGGMQIIVSLYGEDEETKGLNEEDLRFHNEYDLMSALGEYFDDGFTVGRDFGDFVIDNENERAIEIHGEPDPYPDDNAFVLSYRAFDAGAKYWILFVEEGYSFFAKDAFVPMHLFGSKKKRPISLGVFRKNYVQLVWKKDKKLLDRLYKESFGFQFGKKEGE